jgi:hypothetical protein
MMSEEEKKAMLEKSRKAREEYLKKQRAGRKERKSGWFSKLKDAVSGPTAQDKMGESFGSYFKKKK